jgi:hypothetical protein
MFEVRFEKMDGTFFPTRGEGWAGSSSSSASGETTGRVKLLGHFWSESCIIPAQMMRDKLNFDNQLKKFRNSDVPLRTTSFSELSKIEQFRLFLKAS